MNTNQAAQEAKVPRILVVDDMPDNLFLMHGLFEDRYEVVQAASGKEALKIVMSANPPDMVLLDIMMPDMDGYETTRAIRKMAKFKKLPIIALTAKAMVGDREKCLEAGASDYLSKPVNVEQLTSLMQVWLSR